MSVFTTGAHIAPYQRKDGKYVWVVTKFEDDTFMDGDCIDPDIISATQDELINRIGEDEDDEEDSEFSNDPDDNKCPEYMKEKEDCADCEYLMCSEKYRKNGILIKEDT